MDDQEIDRLQRIIKKLEWKVDDLKVLNGRAQTAYAALRAIHASLMWDFMTREEIARELDERYPQYAPATMIDDMRTALNAEYQQRIKDESDNEKEAA